MTFSTPFSRVFRPPFGPGLAAAGAAAGMAAWWKADSIAGLSDGDDISAWSDSSGNGRDLAFSSPLPWNYQSVIRPVYKSAIVNGLPVARFTTANTAMYFGEMTNIRTTFWVVYESTRGMHFWLGHPSSYHFHRGASGEYCYNNTNALMKNAALRINGSAVSNNLTEQPPEAAWFLLSMVSSVDMSGWYFTSDRTIANRSWLGDIAEVIVYTTSLDAASVAATEDYLIAKYGL